MDENGAPVNKAEVTVHLRSGPLQGPHSSRTAPAPVFIPFTGRVVTGSDGTFVVDKVPPGLVQVCVAGPTSDFVDPCHWRPDVNRFAVTEQQVVTLGSLRVERGYPLEVTLSDPRALWTERLSASETKADPDFLVGVVSPVVGFRLLGISHSGSVSRFRGRIPYDVPLRVSVFSRRHAFRVGSGKEVRQFIWPIDVKRGSPPLLALEITRKYR